MKKKAQKKLDYMKRYQKKKYCTNFHLNGACRFGEQCNFLHEKVLVEDHEDCREFIYHPRHLYFERYFKEGEEFLDHISYESKLKDLEEAFDNSKGNL